MNDMVMLDTSFLISLVDRNRPGHTAAKGYYKYFLDHDVVMFLSCIVASEFAIRQPVTDLPLRNFRVLPFNLPDAVQCAELNGHYYRQQVGVGARDAVKDDFKILGQGLVQQVRFLVTEDEDTLCRYCDRLRAEGKIQFKVIKLSQGFDESFVNGDGQKGLGLHDSA